MTPEWLNDVVRAFGRQMGLPRFELNDRGAAALRFENGVSLRIEYANEALAVTAGVPFEPDARALKRLLLAVHPDAVRGRAMRAGWFARTGEAFLSCRIGERDASVTELEAVFRQVWSAAEQLRRAVS